MKLRNLKRIVSLFGDYLFTFCLCSLFILISYGTALAKSAEERTAKLVEGAKKEGRVVWYTGMGVETNDKVRRGFEKKYPFIKMDVYRAHGARLGARVNAEDRAGKHIWDTISCMGFNMKVIQKFFVKYTSPEAKAIPEECKDPEGYWAAIYLSPVVMGYNTRMVSPQDIPRTYNDLLDPKWKGKMAFDGTDVEWFANYWKLKGEKECLDFTRKLSGQDLHVMTGHTTQAQLLAAGEFHIGVLLFAHNIEKLKEQGAPIDWMPLKPAISYLAPIAVAAKAPHPNGARLFTDYILSQKGQTIIASDARLSPRPDVAAKYPKMKYGWQASDISLVKDFKKYRKQFREIFYKKK